MRAKWNTRACGAVRTRTLSITLAVAAALLGSASAAALAAQSSSGTSRRSRTHATTGLRARTRGSAAAFERLLVHRNVIARPAGATVVVHGLMRPGRRGAKVSLQTRAGRHWRTLGVARTHRNGRFGIRYRVRGTGATPLRVAFAGNRRARAASAAAGRIVALAPMVASWYYDAGNTACGFHATYGVANRTLPCGTKVTLSYGGRTVVATVDDRGPYVYGRSFDLNQTTARYLGMLGVGRVFASV